MEIDRRQFVLEYLAEYELGQPTKQRKRNVWVKKSPLRGGVERAGMFDMNYFGFNVTRRFEGREDADDREGIWPINAMRCDRRLGNPGMDVYPRGTPISTATPEIYAEAFNTRVLCYHYISSAAEAIALLASGSHSVRYASEVTSDWYDPPSGVINVTDPSPKILGCHSVPIDSSLHVNGEWRFIFPNTWGEIWGYEGHGSISAKHFDRFIVESWNSILLGFTVPYSAKQGLICLEWKWAATDHIGLHVREIIDAESGQRLAWAFCKKRDGFLDVEEFFVWPTERRKGYGRHLANMVLKLAKDMKLPIRVLVSFADTESENESNLQTAARLLNVEFRDSFVRWVHLFGFTRLSDYSGPQGMGLYCSPIRERPLRPAIPLETLRPFDEPTIDAATDYLVYFGTDRALVDPEKVIAGFSSKRGGKLQLGRALVRIPRTPRFGARGRYWISRWKRLAGDHPQLVQTALIGTEAELGDELRTHFFSDWGDETHNLLFVHGFNTTFEDAVKQAAQLGVDLRVTGQTFCYSWPSAGQGIKSYVADSAALEASLQSLIEFIAIALRQTGDAPLSILVHSMGNRAIIRWLESIVDDATFQFQGRIKNLIFAAPDVDVDVFQQSVPKILGIPKHTTLYITPADRALGASQWVHDYGRAGLSPPVITIPEMDTVQVEGFNMLNLGHAYYREAESVLHDIYVLLHLGGNPSRRRNIERAETDDGREYWRLLLRT